MPKPIREGSSLFFGLALYFNAWFDLDYERRDAFIPIGMSACWKYAEHFGFDEIQTEDLWYYVARMDREFLKWKKSKQQPTEG